MASEKKIRVSVEGNQFTSFLDRAKQLYSELDGEARKLGLTEKDRVRYIQQRISFLERETHLYHARREAEIKSEFAKKIQQAKTPTEKSILEKRRREALEKLKKEKREDKVIAQTLKDILQTQKEQLRLAQIINRKRERERQTLESLWRQEVKEAPDRVRAKIKKATPGFFGRLMGKKQFEGLSPQEVEKLTYQQSLLSKQKQQQQQSILKQLLTAKFLENAIKSVGSAIGGTVGATSEVSGVGQLAGAVIRSGSAAFSAIPRFGAAIGALGEAGASVVGPGLQRHVEEVERRNAANLRVRALTGGTVRGEIRYGQSTADIANIATQVARAMGTSQALQRETRRTLALQYGYGLERGEIISSLQTGRLTNMRGTEMLGRVISEGVRKGIFSRGDFSALPELIQTQSSLIQQIASASGGLADASQVAGTVTTFRNLGGIFATQQLQPILSSIQQTLSTPQSDFMKAQSFAALSRIAPNASILDVLEMQQKGLGQKDYLYNFLQVQKEMFGGDVQSMALNLMQMMPQLGAGGAKQLVQQFLASPETFKEMGETELLKFEEITKGRPVAGKIQQQKAAIEEAYADSVAEGIKKTFILVGKRLTSEVVDIVKEMVTGTDPKTNPDKNITK